jgi:hypothetical protein
VSGSRRRRVWSPYSRLCRARPRAPRGRMPPDCEARRERQTGDRHHLLADSQQRVPVHNATPVNDDRGSHQFGCGINEHVRPTAHSREQAPVGAPQEASDRSNCQDRHARQTVGSTSGSRCSHQPRTNRGDVSTCRWRRERSPRMEVKLGGSKAPLVCGSRCPCLDRWHGLGDGLTLPQCARRSSTSARRD